MNHVRTVCYSAIIAYLKNYQLVARGVEEHCEYDQTKVIVIICRDKLLNRVLGESIKMYFLYFVGETPIWLHIIWSFKDFRTRTTMSPITHPAARAKIVGIL